MMMKWTVIVLLASLFICGSSFGATLNLRATWTANTETDMRDYRLYRTDGTRTLIGTIPHPNTSYNFSVTVPDQSSGTLFVLTAVDTNNNESLVRWFACIVQLQFRYDPSGSAEERLG